MTTHKYLMKSALQPLTALLACGLAVSGLAGCGTGNSPGAALPSVIAPGTSSTAPAAASGVAASDATIQRGIAQFTIRWPQQAGGTSRAAHPASSGQRTRLIPIAAQSLRITLQDAANPATIIKQTLVARPTPGQNTSTIVLDNLPAIALVAVASAYPNVDGSGTAQAVGTAPLTIQSSQTTTVDLQLNSTIAALQIVPATIRTTPNASATLSVSATDAGGAIVLLPTAGTTLSYVIDNTAIASVNGTGTGGTVAGVRAGNANLAVTDTESGISGTAVINVGVGAGNVIVPVR